MTVTDDKRSTSEDRCEKVSLQEDTVAADNDQNTGQNTSADAANGQSNTPESKDNIDSDTSAKRTETQNDCVNEMKPTKDANENIDMEDVEKPLLNGASKQEIEMKEIVNGNFQTSDVSNENKNTPGGGKEAVVFMELEESEKDNWVPDGGWGWFVVLGGVISHVYVGGMMKASGVMYLKLEDHFGQSAVATAWVFSLFTTFLLMMGPVASAMCHRFSCRTVVYIGSVLSLVGVFVSAYAPNIIFLYISYSVIAGFGRCLTYAPSLILITEYFEKRRGLAVGIATAGVGLGMFSFPPLIEALFNNYGYSGAMVMLAGVGLQSFICAALFRPLSLHKKISKIAQYNKLIKMAKKGNTDARRLMADVAFPTLRQRCVTNGKKPTDEEWKGSNIFSSTTEFTYIDPDPPKKSRISEKFLQVKQVFKGSNSATEEKKPFLELSLLKDFPFLTLCLAILLFTMSMISTFVFLPPLAKSKGVSQLQSAYLVSIIGVSDSVARFTSGFVLDLKRVKPYRVLVYNAVMFGVGIVSIIMPSLHGFNQFAVIAACYGVLAGTYVAQKSVVVVDFLGVKKMASSFGLLLGFQGIGSLVGPTLSGLFRDLFGTYDQAFYFGGIGIFFGGVVLLCGNVYKIIRDRREKKDEDTEA